jgi:hypothetical protein
MRERRVPGKAEWQGYDRDLDATYAHKLLYGREISEVLDLFRGGRGIERASELAFMPRKAFQYYIFAFVEYLRSEAAAGDSDGASPFLRLLIERESRDPGSVTEIYAEIAPTIDFVVASQDFFDADPTIYGDFAELGTKIRDAVRKRGAEAER